MALALNTTVILSCAASEEESGPTIVHSSGVEAYRIHPEIIRFLQESCSNERLCDHEKGVQCIDPPAHILEVFRQTGFTVTNRSNADDRVIWILTKTSEAAADNPSGGADVEPQPGEEEEQYE